MASAALIRRLKRGALYTFAVILSIYLIIWSSSPLLVRHLLQDMLKPMDLELAPESSVRYNPFATQVTVNQFALLSGDEPVLSLQQAKLDISLPSLLFSQLNIEAFNVNGLKLIVDLSDNQLAVSGFHLASDTPATQPEDNQVATSGTAPTALDKFRLIAPLLHIKNSHIIIRKNTSERIIHIDALKTNNTQLSLSEQSTSLSIALRIDGAPLLLDAYATANKGQGSLEFTSSLDDLLLGLLSPELNHFDLNLKGKLSYQLSGSITFTPNHQSISLKPSRIELDDLSLNYEDFAITQTRFNLGLKTLDYTTQTNTLNSLIELSQSDFAIRQVSSNDLLFSLEHMTSAPISVDYTMQDPKNPIAIQFDSLELSGLQVSQVEAHKEPALVKLSQILLHQLSFDQQGLNLAKLQFKDLDGNFKINENKELTTLVTMAQSQEENLTTTEASEAKTVAEPQDEQDQPANSDLPIHIQHIEFVGKNQFKFADESVSPAYLRSFSIDEAWIKNINNRSDIASPFALKGRSNEYATLDLSGSIKPFTEHTNLTLQGAIKEVSLPAVSSYLKESLGFEILAGQLDTQLDVAIVESQLDGKIKLNMRGADMTSANNDETGSIKDKTMIPLNVALGMLKDGKGNIKLSVPLSGSVDDPGFGISSFIILVAKKAALSQAKSYLMATFVPYASVVSVGISATKFALKLRFEDLPYAHQQVIPDETQEQYIKEFTALIQEKEEHQVKVCGIAVPQDIGLTSEVDIADETSRQRLRDIATSRAENFKRRVLEQGKIESSRLLICAPQIDYEDNATGRLELSI